MMRRSSTEDGDASHEADDALSVTPAARSSARHARLSRADFIYADVYTRRRFASVPLRDFVLSEYDCRDAAHIRAVGVPPPSDARRELMSFAAQMMPHACRDESTWSYSDESFTMLAYQSQDDDAALHEVLFMSLLMAYDSRD